VKKSEFCSKCTSRYVIEKCRKLTAGSNPAKVQGSLEYCLEQFRTVYCVDYILKFVVLWAL
jgi:hypothetical protein